MLKKPFLGRGAALFFLFILPSFAVARAQDVPGRQSAPVPAMAPTPSPQVSPSLSGEHRFWDRTNLALFAGVTAVRTLDYTSTRHFRARGVNEGLLSNSIVDNKPLFVGIEAAGTAVSIGVAYLLHRSGHHRLERWVSIVHIGVGTFGDVRNYTLGSTTGAPSP